MPAPVSVELPGRATFTEVTFGAVAGQGAYGAYCRGSGGSRYELTLWTD